MAQPAALVAPVPPPQTDVAFTAVHPDGHGDEELLATPNQNPMITSLSFVEWMPLPPPSTATRVTKYSIMGIIFSAALLQLGPPMPALLRTANVLESEVDPRDVDSIAYGMATHGIFGTVYANYDSFHAALRVKFATLNDHAWRTLTRSLSVEAFDAPPAAAAVDRGGGRARGRGRGRAAPPAVPPTVPAGSSTAGPSALKFLKLARWTFFSEKGLLVDPLLPLTDLGRVYALLSRRNSVQHRAVQSTLPGRRCGIDAVHTRGRTGGQCEEVQIRAVSGAPGLLVPSESRAAPWRRYRRSERDTPSS